MSKSYIRRKHIFNEIVTPDNTTNWEYIYYDEVDGNNSENDFYPIALNKYLTLQLLVSGAPNLTGGTTIEIYYAPNGDNTEITLIDVLMVNGNTIDQQLNWKSSVKGDNTNKILLRVIRNGPGDGKIYVKLKGYESQ